MKIQTSKINKVEISDAPGIDPINVILEDTAPKQGRIIIECFGQSWTAFWGGMGYSTIAQFFCACDQHYLANKLSTINEWIDDFDALVDLAKEEILEKRREDEITASDARELYEECTCLEDGITHNHNLMQKIFGDEWFMKDIVPKKPNPDYQYLYRIITTVQHALHQIDTSQQVKHDEKSDTIKIPADPRYKDQITPQITNEMKAECIGEFLWTEEADYYNKEGELIEHVAERVVPWDLCKKIYQRMVMVAARSKSAHIDSHGASIE